MTLLWILLSGCSSKVSWDDCAPEQDRLSAATQIVGTKGSDHFGQAIATGDIDGDGVDDLAVGSPNYDPTEDSNFNAGMATVFLGDALSNSGTLQDVDAALTIFGVDEMSGTASSLGFSDVDDDGLADLWIGAHQGEVSGQDTGVVYLFYGSSLESKISGNTLSIADADLTLIGVGNYDYVGFSMANAGDVDGDKKDDWLIGAHQADAEAEDVGKTYLFYAETLLGLSGEQSIEVADVTFVGETENDFSGYSVAGNIDVDKDGLSDIIIGAGNHDSNGNDAGATYLFLGASLSSTSSGTVSLSSADLKMVGSAEGDWSGRRVATMPKADRDRRGDMVISSSWNDDVANNAGKVSIVTGAQAWDAINSGASLFSLSDAALTIAGSEQESFFGQVLSVGDLDGDRYSDLLIGSPLHDSGDLADAGVVQLFFGKDWQDSLDGSTLSSESSGSTLVGSIAYDALGTGLTVGDLDGAGIEEVIIGSPYADDEELDGGGVSVFWGCE